MADDMRSSRATRILRFTVTSALVLAPLAGCGGTPPGEEEYVNTGPVVEPRPATPPVTDPAAEDDAGVDSGPAAVPIIDAPGHSGANPGPGPRS